MNIWAAMIIRIKSQALGLKHSQWATGTMMDSRVRDGGIYSSASSRKSWEGRAKHGFRNSPWKIIFKMYWVWRRVYSLFQMVFITFIIRKHSLKKKNRASLVVQWLRICLPMQGTRVRALVWEDPTCRGATRSVSHNY